jgi:MarR family transcriptional regulator for hemolysin
METNGLVTRVRDASNRRSHIVALTADGEAMFLQLRNVAMTFDKRLHSNLASEDVATFERVLNQLTNNAK